MQIKFMGAAGTVTGSSYILTSGSGQAILIDLGMFQGLPEIDCLNYEPYEYDFRSLSGAVLTHAHLDHCGRLPLLLAKDFREKIWMTSATRDLTELSLYDTAKIAKFDKKKALFDKELAEKTINQFMLKAYHEPFQIGDFTITFRDAGHILGSASLEIVDAHSNSEVKKIVFSGDLGNSPEELQRATEYLESSDAVVMESTYGDRLHPQLDPKEILISEIQSVEKSGGTLLIPAFSLERSQELLHMIKHLKESGKVRETTPIFLDSPMAEKATQVYMNFSDLLNDHIRQDFEQGNPFDFPGLNVVMAHDDSEEIDKHSGTKVIIAGSGMMTGGRILGHSAHYLPLASTRLLIVGYQGEGTLGRQLLEGEKKFTIEKNSISVNATVSSTRAMSSHADQKQLIKWLQHMNGVKKVFLTHGEETARVSLSKKITEELGYEDIVLPVMHQEVTF